LKVNSRRGQDPGNWLWWFHRRGAAVLDLRVGLAEHFVLHPNWQPFLTIGLLGAFTTFSTFSFETMALVEVGSYSKALLNLGASVLLGLVAVLAGLIAGRAL